MARVQDWVWQGLDLQSEPFLCPDISAVLASGVHQEEEEGVVVFRLSTIRTVLQLRSMLQGLRCFIRAHTKRSAGGFVPLWS